MRYSTSTGNSTRGPSSTSQKNSSVAPSKAATARRSPRRTLARGRGRLGGLVLLFGDEVTAVHRAARLASAAVVLDRHAHRAEALLADDALRRRVARGCVAVALEVLGQVVGAVDANPDRLAALAAADVVVHAAVG